MLTPEQVNAYAGLLAAPWDELNERILRDMVRRIVKAGGVTATAEWQSYRAQALGASKAYLIQQMNLIVQQIGPKEAAIFAQAMKQAYEIDVNDAAKAGRVLPTLGENEEARQIVQSGYRRTMNTLYNLTQTRALMGNLNMTETSQRQLAYYLDMAHADAISGAFSPARIASSSPKPTASLMSCAHHTASVSNRTYFLSKTLLTSSPSVAPSSFQPLASASR